MNRSARPPTQPGKTAVLTQLVVLPTSPQQTSLPSLVFHHFHKLLLHSFFLRCWLTCYLLILFSGTCWELNDGSGVAKFTQVASFSANLCASFTSVENPFSHSLSSKIQTLLIIGSGFSYSLIAILVLINLYSWPTDLSPRSLLSLTRYNTAVELRGCLCPFSLINFLVSLSMLCKSPNG